MFFDKNEIDIKDLYKELQNLNNKLDLIIYQNKNQGILNIPEVCRHCPNYPSNGGSGICHCILGQQVTC